MVDTPRSPKNGSKSRRVYEDIVYIEIINEIMTPPYPIAGNKPNTPSGLRNSLTIVYKTQTISFKN